MDYKILYILLIYINCIYDNKMNNFSIHFYSNYTKWLTELWKSQYVTSRILQAENQYLNIDCMPQSVLRAPLSTQSRL